MPAAMMCLLLSLIAADQTVPISATVKDAAGFLVHEVRSPFQASTTKIRVLLPDNMARDKSLPVVYVLPVEAGSEAKYGDGLLEIKKRGLQNRFGAVFVAPTFSHLPWYADHPTNPEIRQESCFVNVVVPFIDKTYQTRADAEHRYLLGFSKSGWGAWSLLLRHPDLFHKAAAWDAPIMMDKPGPYGSGDIFGTVENFERYRLDKLLERRADSLGKEKRLLLLGYGNFRAQHETAHALMDKLKIAHEYRDGPSRTHDWHSGWVTEAVELLLGAPAGVAPGATYVIPPGLPVTNGSFIRVFRNRIEGNNHVNFAPKGNLVADVPAGTGLLMQAANNVEVFDNDIVDNDTANVLITSFLVTSRPLRDPKYDPYSEGIAIHHNRIARGGKRPSGKLGELVAPLVGGRFADIVSDGAENRAKFENGKLPEALGIRLADNGDVSFLNFNLAKLTPANILAGRYRFERDVVAWAGELPALPSVVLEPAAPPAGVNAAIAAYREAPPSLSSWGLFAGEPKNQQPARGVLAYELNTPLFSDYTSKHRFIRLPQGQRIAYRPEGILEFPVGTVIAKTFSMPHETSQPEGSERLLETRIQVRKDSGWYGFR
ncbi:MAG TPA: alpha/beta hydrolase-fold protein, partial [Planctomycetaceae bacterium]